MRHRQTDQRLSGAPTRRGFTLVELLVVVAIIALLVTILLPTLTRAKEIARRAVCSANLHAMGQGWAVYFNESNNRTPNQFNPRVDVADNTSQFNYVVWCRAGAGGPAYTNVGLLYKKKTVSNANVYVCPTVGAVKNPWFSSVGGGWSSAAVGSNPWPVIDGSHTRMTYGTRRMNNYDDPNAVINYNDWNGNANTTRVAIDNPATRGGGVSGHPMLWANSQGVGSVKLPGDFSFMADHFGDYEKVMLAHIPGVNVLYLDWHVRFYEDAKGDVLYNNGLDPALWGADSNWKHDDIWMIIDGYHKAPVGQGISG